MKPTHSNNLNFQFSSLNYFNSSRCSVPLRGAIVNSQFSIPLIAAAALLLLASCHKNCVCQGYDGGSYTYTSEEVDAQGVTCPNMIFQAGQQFYAVCDWE